MPGLKRHRAEADPTLNENQAKNRGYRPEALLSGGDFRYPSNTTLKGYSSGYHEAAVTTDTFNFLKRAHKNLDGTYTLPSAASKGSVFNAIAGQKVKSKNWKYVLEYADGFRTDTAQTILSGPGGTAAGHSGSGVDTSGQADAHDLLRHKIVEILKLDPKTEGFTERSVVAVLASMTVTSIAPGVVARTVTGGTASLKAGPDAKQDWEKNRNEAKRRVENILSGLDPKEKKFVREHASSFMASTQEGVTGQLRRRIPPSRATSPERVEAVAVAGLVAGGRYVTGAAPTLKPSSLPPQELKQTGLYVTQTFRAPRRVVAGKP